MPVDRRSRTHAEIVEIKRAYYEGATAAQLAEEYGLAVGSMRNLLRRYVQLPKHRNATKLSLDEVRAKLAARNK